MMQLELLNQFMSCQIELPNFVADLVKALCKELVVVSVEDVQLCSIFLAPYSDVS